MINEIINQKLGIPGAMISSDKELYIEEHPTHKVFFNGNIIIDNKKVWFGDIDVTYKSKIIQELADELNKNIYIIPESDGRFDNEEKPLLHNAVVFKCKQLKLNL